MPRFYFHFHGAGTQLRDEDGLALPDAEAAWYQAVRSARELIGADRRLGCSWTGQAVAIEDEKGLPVAEIPLSEIATYAV